MDITKNGKVWLNSVRQEGRTVYTSDGRGDFSAKIENKIDTLADRQADFSLAVLKIWKI